MPEVRLILMIRNPVEQLWSHAVHDLVRIPGIQVADVPESTFFAYFTKRAFHRMGGYTGILDRWLSVFPTEQLYVGFFDDVKRRPKSLLYDVFRHIGVSVDVDWARFPWNAIVVPPAGPQYEKLPRGRGVVGVEHVPSTAMMPSKYRDFLEELYYSDILNLEKRFGKRISPDASKTV